MPRHRAAPLDIDPTGTDGALAQQATAGHIGAFEELYRRHAQAAWRVAQSVTRNTEDAADAVSEAFAKVLKAVSAHKLQDADRFRSYLLSATRNAAVDVQRRRGRVQPTDAPDVLDGPSSRRGPSDALEDGADRDLVATAFRSLPERWRSVLWLTEVEGIPAREAAGLLGVSANGVAQLAVRARAGLRQRFLQAHLNGNDVDDTCRFTVEHLGAYVAGGLSPRELAKVDQHLAACGGCRLRREELEDLGGSLRKIVLPFPIGLAALSLGKWQAAAGITPAAAAAAGAGAAAGGASTPAWLLKAQRPLAIASVGLFAAGIVGASVVGQSTPGPRIGGERETPATEIAAPTVLFTPAVAVGGSPGGAGGGRFASTGGRGAGGGGGGTGGTDTVDVVELPRAEDGGGGDPPTTPSNTTTTVPVTVPTTTPTTTSTSTTSTTAPPPRGDANVYVKAGTTTVSGAVGTRCTGGTVGTMPVGQCAPPPPPDPDYTVIVETPLPNGRHEL